MVVQYLVIFVVCVCVLCVCVVCVWWCSIRCVMYNCVFFFFLNDMTMLLPLVSKKIHSFFSFSTPLKYTSPVGEAGAMADHDRAHGQPRSSSWGQSGVSSRGAEGALRTHPLCEQLPDNEQRGAKHRRALLASERGRTSTSFNRSGGGRGIRHALPAKSTRRRGALLPCLVTKINPFEYGIKIEVSLSNLCMHTFAVLILKIQTRRSGSQNPLKIKVFMWLMRLIAILSFK
jgi:hypothetical protein